MGNRQGRRKSDADQRGDGADDVFKEDAADRHDLIERQTTEALKNAGRFELLLLKEKSSLGGLIRQRVEEEDAVKGLDHEVLLKIWSTIRDRSSIQSQYLIAKQKQVHVHLKSCAQTSEQAAQTLYFASDKLATHSKQLDQVSSLTNDVQTSIDLLHACINQCNQLLDLLPEEDKIEPLSFSQ